MLLKYLQLSAKHLYTCFAEISNLLVVTKERAQALQTPMQESQLSFHRILKEEIEQVQQDQKHENMKTFEKVLHKPAEVHPCCSHLFDTTVSLTTLFLFFSAPCLVTRRSISVSALKPTSIQAL